MDPPLPPRDEADRGDAEEAVGSVDQLELQQWCFSVPQAREEPEAWSQGWLTGGAACWRNQAKSLMPRLGDRRFSGQGSERGCDLLAVGTGEAEVSTDAGVRVAAGDGGYPITGYTLTLNSATGAAVVRQLDAGSATATFVNVPAGSSTATVAAVKVKGTSGGTTGIRGGRRSCVRYGRAWRSGLCGT